jgi:hypothetical protein
MDFTEDFVEIHFYSLKFSSWLYQLEKENYKTPLLTVS